MADYTVALTGTAEVSDSLVKAFSKAVWIQAGQGNVSDQFVTPKIQIGAESISMPKFARTAAATTPLNEREEVASTALVDTKILIVPKERGFVVTLTNLASLQTGGVVDMAAAQEVGNNWATTMDILAVKALDASTNKLIVGGVAETALAAGGIATRSFLNQFYNKLARASIPKINGSYVAMLHDDVVNDLRNDSSVGSWVDVSKYSNPESVFNNEVGMLSGFHVVTNNNNTFADQSGAGLVDVYNSYFFGANGLGKVISQPGQIRLTGPFDKLGRFYNIGWYEVSEYSIIDQDAVWVGQTAASVGANTVA